MSKGTISIQPTPPDLGGEKSSAPPKRPLRKIWHISRNIILAVIGFFFILIVLLQLPWVQTRLASLASGWLKKKFDVDVSIERVEINFFKKTVHLIDVMALDHHADTLIHTPDLGLEVGSLDFGKGNLIVSTVYLNEGYVNIRTYKGENKPNITLLIDKFRSNKPKKRKKGKPFMVSMEYVSLNECRVRVRNENRVSRPADFIPNDIEINRISGNVNQFEIRGDSLLFEVKSLRAWEQSGIIMSDFKARVLICSSEIEFTNFKLKTPHSNLSGYYSMRYRHWSSMSNFIDSVTMVADLNLSNIDMTDIAFFAEPLKGIDANFRVKGGVKGPISKLRAKDFSIYFGSISQIVGDFSLTGLPDIYNTDMLLQIDKLTTHYYDLCLLPVPPFSEKEKLHLPEEIKRLGVIKFSGGFMGFINDFYADGKIQTPVGSAKVDLTIESKNKLPAYNGNLSLTNLDIGHVFNIKPDVGKISLNGNIKGRGFELSTIDAAFKGHISLLEIKGYGYSNIKTDAHFKNQLFNGFLAVKDPNIDMSFSGSINMTNPHDPQFNFQDTLRYANLKQLGWVKADTMSILSTIITANFSGRNIDQINGSIKAKNLSYQVSSTRFMFIPDMELKAYFQNEENKILSFRSPFAEIDINGHFKLIPLFNDLNLSINQVFPSAHLPYNVTIEPVLQRFDYSIKLYQTDNVLNVFYPNMRISDQSILKGRFDTGNNIFGENNDYIPWIKYKQMKVEDWRISMSHTRGELKFESNASAFYFTDSLKIDNVMFNITAHSDTLHLWAGFYNKTRKQNAANINAVSYVGNAPKFEFNFHDTYFYFNDSLWMLSNENRVVLDSASLLIEDIELYATGSRYPMITINGENSYNKNLPIRISMNDFPLDISDYFLKPSNINLDGMANGKVELYKIFSETPYFTSDLTINAMYVNKVRLGELALHSRYVSDNKSIIINSNLKRDDVKNISIKDGLYFPFRDKDQLDINVDISGFSLAVFEPILKPNFTHLNGGIYGSLQVLGTTKKPLIDANLHLEDAGFRIGFTQVYYKIRHSNNRDILLNNEMILLKDIQIEDKFGNKGLLDGRITHTFFNDIKLNLALRLENLCVLETTARQNDQFYGTAFASGNASISGPIDNLILDALVETEKNTILNIPIQKTSEIDETNFIVYIKADTNDVQESQKKSSIPISNFTLNLNVKVTPDATCRVIFDETLGDIITASGTSDNLSVAIDSKGKFNMFGVYEITRGDYLFTLQNLINKQFVIKPGSSISWSGNPFEALINATAVYKANTSLYPIVSAFMDHSIAELYKRTTRINCELLLSNKLSNPIISFNMELPNTDEATRSLVKATLANEDEMNRQVFALLIMNQFLPPESIGSSGTGSNFMNSGLGSGLGSTSLELLAGQINNWLSKLTKDVSLNLKYKTGDASTADQVNVALTTQFFNQRLIIDSDIGIGGQKASTTNGTTNQVVGNVTAEFKVTQDGKLRLKAFNRSNENNLLKNSANYTQGVGISYRQEFNSWKDLFKKKESRIKTSQNDTLPTDSLSTPNK
ncbi:MAG: translocation/assembly module TamB [Flavobacteriales bacterium]|nr:translocation/assembly module TamB [Flavobacteriales bacterium]